MVRRMLLVVQELEASGSVVGPRRVVLLMGIRNEGWAEAVDMVGASLLR